MNPRLKNIIDHVDRWCDENDISYNLISNENDVQGLLFLKKDRPSVYELIKSMHRILDTSKVHSELKLVRGGIILVLSVKALSESQIETIIGGVGKELNMTFNDRIINALSGTVAAVPDTKSNQPSLNEAVFIKTALNLDGSPRTNKNRPIKIEQTNNTKPTRFESKISKVFGNIGKHYSFNSTLEEALDGMATPDGEQPTELFGKFAQALSVLGNQIGIGPLQQQLKNQGINWKKSDDGQSIIMYVMNAQTNAPQPIARISSETLSKPSDFETQLLNIMDFARGDAPGTFKMRQQEAQAQEKAAREIAKQMGPQDPNSIDINKSEPQSPPPVQQTAPQAAAQTAAMPKRPDQPSM